MHAIDLDVHNGLLRATTTSDIVVIRGLHEYEQGNGHRARDSGNTAHRRRARLDEQAAAHP
jgi:hypothetical protein